MNNYFQDIDILRGVMRGAAHRLMVLANALDTVGQSALSDKIAAEAEALDEAQARLRHVVTGKLNADHDEAARGVGQMLTFLLQKAGGER